MASMIELQGTEKQVKWANRLREEIIDEMSVIIAKSEVDPATDAPTLAKLRKVFEGVCAQNQAKWWIDNQGETGRSLILKGMKAK